MTQLVIARRGSMSSPRTLALVLTRLLYSISKTGTLIQQKAVFPLGKNQIQPLNQLNWLRKKDQQMPELTAVSFTAFVKLRVWGWGSFLWQKAIGLAQLYHKIVLNTQNCRRWQLLENNNPLWLNVLYSSHFFHQVFCAHQLLELPKGSSDGCVKAPENFQ